MKKKCRCLWVIVTVSDITGAVVAGATVSLLNTGTGFSRQATTGPDGTYEFLVVPVGGGYAIQVAASGFSNFEQTGIRLTVNQSMRVDFQLKPGQATEEVTVQAGTVQVETTVTQLGEVIEDKKILALPLNGRNYLDLLGLQAGVSLVSVSGGANNVSVNGQRENANGFMVNGGSVENTSGNSANIIPVLDSIQEFRLLTNAFNAEYGHFYGALVNVITKSGTNSFYGTAFEFLRNNALDARNYFDPIGPVGEFHRNQFGGVISGPIIKDLLFFFGDYQGTRESRAYTTPSAMVPTVSERSGDFSDRAGSLTGSVPGGSSPGTFASVLTIRLGYVVNPGELFYIPGCTTTAACVFSGALIPTKAWSPAAAGTLEFILNPSPELNGATFITNAFPMTTIEDKFGTRVDLNTKRTAGWTFYYNHWGRHTFKFGGGFGYYIWNRRGGSLPNGAFGFDGGETGIDFADYMLGLPASFTQSSAQELDARSKMIDLFGEDSFRVGPELILNFGLRWEASNPWYDTTGKIQAFIPDQQSTVYTNALTGLLFPGDKGIPKTFAYTRWNNITPRFGITYAPSASDGPLKHLLGAPGQTSVRAGFGIFYTDFDTSGQNFATGDAPFGLYVNGTTHPYLEHLEQPYTNFTTGANKLQPFPFVFPTSGPTNFAPYLPITFSPAFDTVKQIIWTRVRFSDADRLKRKYCINLTNRFAMEAIKCVGKDLSNNGPGIIRHY